MKLNKFFAVAMAALALVACEKPGESGGGGGEAEALKLDQTSATVEVGKTVTITANIAVDEWSSSKPEVATVDKGVVTGVAEGSAIITAKAGTETKTCVVKVTKAGGSGTTTGVKLEASKVWPLILDGVTYAANEDKIVASFQPNDVDQFLYIWESTYAANDNPTGMNFFKNTEGFTALTVGQVGWSGCGFCLTKDGTGWEAAEALRQEIVANPDQYFLHMAIKSTDNCDHCFYFMGNEATKFVLGSASCYDGPVLQNFTRNGAWQEFNIPMANYVNALAATPVEAGVNVFVTLSANVPGAQLNLDAVYFYKK